MNLTVLKDELLAGHPDTGPYDADDQIAADQLNAVNRTLPRALMSSTEVYQAIDLAELVALPVADRIEVYDILGFGNVNPFGQEATRFTTLFGPISNTITNLKVLRVVAVSRATEIGLPFVRPGEVQQARAM